MKRAEETGNIRRRQLVWEQKNGPAKTVGARAAHAVLGRGDATPKSGAASFVTDTAKATGRAASVVRQAAFRARERSASSSAELILVLLQPARHTVPDFFRHSLVVLR